MRDTDYELIEAEEADLAAFDGLEAEIDRLIDLTDQLEQSALDRRLAAPDWWR